jgi:hypothetical protein
MNKISTILTILVSAATPYLFCLDDATAQTTHGPTVVSVVFPPDVARPCAFFQLQGVPQADPVAPGQPWFAIPMTNVGYHEQFALVLTAAFNNRPIVVATTGQADCGFAQVSSLYSQFP